MLALFSSSRILAAVAAALFTVSVFGAGWYKGSGHVTDKYAKAIAVAETRGAAAQAAKNAADQETTRKDYQRRAAIDAARIKTLADIAAKHIDNPCKTKVSEENMRALNDPALVGGTR